MDFNRGKKVVCVKRIRGLPYWLTYMAGWVEKDKRSTVLVTFIVGWVEKDKKSTVLINLYGSRIHQVIKYYTWIRRNDGVDSSEKPLQDSGDIRQGIRDLIRYVCIIYI